MAELPTQLPPEVAKAIAEGNLIEAMKLLRARYKGVGLAEARGLLEALQKQGQAKPAAAKVNVHAHAKALPPMRPTFGPKLSPGEVPRGAGGAGSAILLVLAALAIGAFYFRYF